MKHLGLAAAAVAVIIVLTAFIYVTTDIFDGILGGGDEPFAATLTGSVDNRTATLNVTVTGGTAPYSFIFDLGDGTSRITTDPGLVYTYTSSGTYLVKVLVRDAVDGFAEAAINVTIV